MSKAIEISGVVLAGGLSSRMGQDKSEMLFKEQKLIEYSINALKPFCSEILISSNSEKHKLLSCPIIADKQQGIGPIAGLQSVLSNCKHNYVMVLPCDSPLIKSGLVQVLINALEKDYQAIVPIHSGLKEPLFAIYHKEALPFINKNIEDGNYKLMNLLSQLKVKYLKLEEYSESFTNINTPTDYGDLNKSIL